VPGVHPYDGPARGRNEEVDDAVAWTEIVALFSELTPAERTLFIHFMGNDLYQLRNRRHAAELECVPVPIEDT
jgi:hypothetical protein